jgi:signal peptidase II
MRFLWLSALVVALDQATKAAVLQFMAAPGGVPRSIPVLGDWLRLTFTENPGMAFGLTIGPPGTVTVLSILATVLVVGYIYQVRHGYAPYVWSLSLILGGALGNIIDRVFYGVLLDYGPYFTGHVVDFIHVSLWRGFVPDVVPLIGGAYMELFPIWNVADMAIVLGVVGVLAFHRAFHRRRLAASGGARDTAPADAPADAETPDAAPDSDWPATDGVSTLSDGEEDETGGTDGAPSEEWQPDDWPDRARD